jgi:hypothetical protein
MKGDEQIEAIATKLDELAEKIHAAVKEFNLAVDEANTAIGELEEAMTASGDFEDEDIPNYLMEVDLTENDPADYGNELRETFGLATPEEEGDPEPPKAAVTAGAATYDFSRNPIDPAEAAAARAKLDVLCASMGLEHEHKGKMFALHSYRYLLAGFKGETLYAVLHLRKGHCRGAGSSVFVVCAREGTCRHADAGPRRSGATAHLKIVQLIAFSLARG